MKVVPLYCPNCGAPVGKDAKFCSQCGSPIVIDDGVKRSEHIHRNIDETRMHEADVNLEIEKQKFEQQKHFAKFSLIFFGMAFVFFMILISGFLRKM